MHPSVHLSAFFQHLLHLRAAQVEVAVLQPRLLADPARVLGVVGDLEGQRGRGVEDLDVGHDDLDLAGGQVRVGVALRPGAHLAGDGQDVLGPQVVGDLLADDDLGDARGVAQVDEGDAAVVPAPVHPAGQGDGPADVRGSQGPGVTGSQHGDSFRWGHCSGARRCAPRDERAPGAILRGPARARPGGSAGSVVVVLVHPAASEDDGDGQSRQDGGDAQQTRPDDREAGLADLGGVQLNARRGGVGRNVLEGGGGPRRRRGRGGDLVGGRIRLGAGPDRGHPPGGRIRCDGHGGAPDDGEGADGEEGALIGVVERADLRGGHVRAGHGPEPQPVRPLRDVDGQLDGARERPVLGDRDARHDSRVRGVLLHEAAVVDQHLHGG